MKPWLLTAVLAALPVLPAIAQQAGDAVRPLVLLTQPQAASPQDYQAAEMTAEAWTALA